MLILKISTNQTGLKFRKAKIYAKIFTGLGPGLKFVLLNRRAEPSRKYNGLNLDQFLVSKCQIIHPKDFLMRKKEKEERRKRRTVPLARLF